MKFSRNAELEADRLGVQYLYAAGYDPIAMSTMFEKLASQNKKKPGTLLKLFSTHPQSTDRRDGSLALVARFPEREEYVMSTSEFERVRGHLGRLTNARAGITVDFDEAGDAKPTLKRRQPESTEPAGAEGTSTSDGPPKLKRRDEPTTPQPSATPKN
jgi:beta-barrel assembly-enhancing protease